MTTAMLLLNAIVVLVGIGAVARKYGTVLTPVSFFGAYYFVSTVIGPALYQYLGLFGGYEDSVPFSLALSSIYFVAFATAYIWRWSPLEAPLLKLLRFSRPFTPEVFDRSPRLMLVANGALFVALYITLMVTSGAGTKWLTDPRDAYQRYRAGVGIVWSLCQAALMMNFLIWLRRSNRSLWRVGACAIGFAAIALFLGSKASTLAYVVVGAFYAHYSVRRIRTRTVLIGAACLLLIAMGLQLMQGTTQTAIGALLYFDYFANSNMFVQRFDEFGARYGGVTLSMAWFYVPRALFPAKPYSYGAQTIGEFLYPGGAEDVGFTPGLMQWSMPYADFGILGVLLYAMLTAFVSRAVFDLFLKERSLVSMVLLAQLGFVYYIEMFPNAPFPIFWLWMTVQSLIFLLIISVPVPKVGRVPQQA